MSKQLFSTFKPVETPALNKDALLKYYAENNIPVTNNYMDNYLSNIQQNSNVGVQAEIKNLDKTPSIADILGTIEYGDLRLPTIKNFTESGNKAKDIINYFINAGLSKEQAAGIAGNLHKESKFNLKAVGDSGLAVGLAQWHPDRQANFKKLFGKDVKSGSLKEQLDFINWELHNTNNKALKELLKTKTPSEAALAFSKHYERPKIHTKDRETAAEQFYKL